MYDYKHGIILKNGEYEVVNIENSSFPPNLVLLFSKESNDNSTLILENRVKINFYRRILRVFYKNDEIDSIWGIHSIAEIYSTILHYKKFSGDELENLRAEKQEKILTAKEKSLTESIEKLKEQESVLKTEVERLTQLKLTADELLAKTEKFVEVYKELVEAVEN